MIECKIDVPIQKSVCTGEAVVLAAQRYLGSYFVSISEDETVYTLTLQPKHSGTSLPFEAEVRNALIEAAFLHFQAERTKGLREAIMARVLSPYHKD